MYVKNDKQNQRFLHKITLIYNCQSVCSSVVYMALLQLL